MKQEIAVKTGNFCGVCPLIGRLEALLRGVYRRGGSLGRLAAGLFYGPE